MDIPASLFSSPEQLFTGRADLLQSLRSALLERHTIVLTGAPGCGKTTFARAYTRQFAGDYAHVLWIDMATPGTCMASLLHCELEMPVPEDLARKGFAALNEIIALWSAEPDLLLIIDNVHVQQNISNDPGTPEAHVLFIAGSGSEVPDGQALELPMPTAEDYALNLLQQSSLLKSPQPQSVMAEAPHVGGSAFDQHKLALELTHELLCSPDALYLAGGYLKASGMGLQDYLFAYRDCPDRLDGSKDAETQALELACDLTLAALAQSHPAVLHLLQHCALLAPRGIARNLLAQDELLAALFPAEEALRLELLDQALNTLCSYHVLTPWDNMNTFSLPLALRQAIRSTLSLEQQQIIREQFFSACLSLAHSCEETAERPATAVTFALAVQIHALVTGGEGTIPASEQVAEACSWAASGFGEHGLLAEMEELLTHALQVWEQTVGSSDPRVAGTLFFLATCQAQRQHYPEAEVSAQRAVTTTSQVLGAHHPKVLLCLTTLADIYRAQEKLENAALCYQKVLDIGERTSNLMHPSCRIARRALVKLRRTERT